MNDNQQFRSRLLLLAATIAILALSSRLIHADAGTCGGVSITLPFTDVQSSNIFFCAIAEAYFSGLTNGTSMTTYNPADNVPREQMAAFITRTQDSVLKRGNRRAALKLWATPADGAALRAINVFGVFDMACDGADLWVPSFATNGTVTRIRASDGKVLQTWTGAGLALGVVVAASRIFVTAQSVPGKIYVINPEASPGTVTVFDNDIGANPYHITYDGANLWTANQGNGAGNAGVSRVNIATVIDSTFTAGFANPVDILWDGANLWVVDEGDNKLKRVDTSSGLVLESINVGDFPQCLIFDGANIWVSNANSNSITVVRAVGGLRGTVLATLTGNGLNFPIGMAFDGERVLACDNGSGVSLFKAADFTPISHISAPGSSGGTTAACSDGVNFWVSAGNQVVRY